MVSCFSSVAKIRPYVIPDYLFCFKAYYKCYIQSKNSRQGKTCVSFSFTKKETIPQPSLLANHLSESGDTEERS